jgi:hypothetical protein
MSQNEELRVRAAECRRKAEAAGSAAETQTWLMLAHGFDRLIQFRQEVDEKWHGASGELATLQDELAKRRMA